MEKIEELVIKKDEAEIKKIEEIPVVNADTNQIKNIN
jgi:hypothetical protein